MSATVCMVLPALCKMLAALLKIDGCDCKTSRKKDKDISANAEHFSLNNNDCVDEHASKLYFVVT